MMVNYNCVLFFVLIIVSGCRNVEAKKARIAIVGGGIGGTVTAYELSRIAIVNGYEISLDLFESGKIGGRLATTVVNGNEFETGGSVIHVENEHMAHYVTSSGLRWNRDPDSDKDVLGLYNGEEFVFISSGSMVLDTLKLFWRYGLDIIFFEADLVKPLLYYFKRIYKAQGGGETFNDVEILLTYMSEDFPNLMTMKFKDYLKDRGYCNEFMEEFIFLATNVNYNQDIDIPVFVGSVALAGCQDGSLRSVEGGNKRVAEVLFARSDARLVKSRVDSVILRPDLTYIISDDEHSHVYDYVIIACPMIENSKENIKFANFTNLHIPYMKYQKTIATLVHGELNHTFFHYDSPDGLPNQIYSVNNTLFYNSISSLSPVTFDPKYDRKVFKVFSKEILTDEQLDLLFLNRDSVTVIPWLAYPLYDTEHRNLTFLLHDNLFYVNSIEGAASAMEMSAISGYNTALLIFERLKLHRH